MRTIHGAQKVLSGTSIYRMNEGGCFTKEHTVPGKLWALNLSDFFLKINVSVCHKFKLLKSWFSSQDNKNDLHLARKGPGSAITAVIKKKKFLV
jgi:hypothetical protein